MILGHKLNLVYMHRFVVLIFNLLRPYIFYTNQPICIDLGSNKIAEKEEEKKK